MVGVKPLHTGSISRGKVPKILGADRHILGSPLFFLKPDDTSCPPRDILRQSSIFGTCCVEKWPTFEAGTKGYPTGGLRDIKPVKLNARHDMRYDSFAPRPTYKYKYIIAATSQWPTRRGPSPACNKRFGLGENARRRLGNVA